MDRNNLIANLRIQSHKMESVLNEAGIKLSYVQIPEDTTEVPNAFLEEGLAWITELQTKEASIVRAVLKLMPKEQWDHYKMMDMNGAIEMKERASALRELRRAIINKNRPIVFRKKIFSVQKKKRRQTQLPKEGSLSGSPIESPTEPGHPGQQSPATGSDGPR